MNDSTPHDMSKAEKRDPGALRVLVVDDEHANRTVVADIIRGEGHDVDVAASGGEAATALAQQTYDLVVSDIRMPGMSGLELLELAQSRHAEVTMILITAYATVSSAVEAMQKGAFDYLQKPFSKEELLARVRRVVQHGRLVRENRQLRASLASRGLAQILGDSEPIARLRRQIERIVPAASDVLVTGESGTGKELVARALHYESDRRAGPFVAVNCAAIAEGLAESELFGHRKGAFTHATEDRAGRFEQAHGGTLFLDEVSAMPLSLQPKMLRVLQERTVERVGSGEPRRVAVRVVAASNRNLRKMVAQGAFREDLFHRLNVLEIDIPPLRERTEDVELLARVFADRAATRCGLPEPSLSPELIAVLQRYPFPGNVRELEHLLERMVVMAEADLLTVDDLPVHVIEQAEAQREQNALAISGSNGAGAQAPGPGGGPAALDPERLLAGGSVSLMRVEERLLREALRLADGNLSDAARRLGISYKTMRYRVRKFGLGSG